MFEKRKKKFDENSRRLCSRLRLRRRSRDLDRRFRSRDDDRRRSSAAGAPRLTPGGPPRRVEPRPPPKSKIETIFFSKVSSTTYQDVLDANL